MRPIEDLWSEFLATLAFFSRLPLPPPRGRATSGPVPAFAPLAGVIVGLCAALTLLAACVLGLPALVSAALALAVLLVATGALHEDGLADCADGFGGGWDRARKLEIMRDSRIGTYGVCALIMSLAIRMLAIAAMTERAPAAAAAGVVVAACVSRAACLVPLVLLPAARPGGVGASAPRVTWPAMGVAGLLSTAIALTLLPFGIAPGRIVLLVVLGAGAAFAVCSIASRQIQGQTGDVGGAAQQAAEIAALLVLCAS